MPLYEFRCPNGHTTEEIMPADKRDEPMPCVACNEKDGSVVEMRRQVSNFTGKVLGGTPSFFPGRTQKGVK